MRLSKRWTEKNPSFSEVEKNYSPDNWGIMLRDARRAYEWECPLLGQLDTLFGSGSARRWTDDHITALYLSSASRDKGVAASAIGPFVASFAASTARYKLSELMLFFARYKCGIYDRSFASFDARRIGTAFRTEFLPDRTRELAVIEDLRRAEQAAEENRLRSLHAIKPEMFHSLPRKTLYAVIIEWEMPPHFPAYHIVCRYLNINAHPQPGERVEAHVTRHQMRLMHHWEEQHRFRVTDSWLIKNL